MRIAVNMIPAKVMEDYHGATFVEDGYIYFEINELMYEFL